MVEILVAVGIIGVLITLTILVGKGVIEQAKVRQTRDVLRVLDSLLTEYQVEYGSMPPYTSDASGSDNPYVYRPPTGNSEQDPDAVFPEVAVFLAQVRGTKGGDPILASMSTDSLMERTKLYDTARSGGLNSFCGSVDEPADLTPARLSIADAWGMEILYIHPDNSEATEGSGAGDFRGYGRAAAKRPYFMSAGPDFRYDTLEDNVYSLDTVEKP